MSNTVVTLLGWRRHGAAQDVCPGTCFPPTAAFCDSILPKLDYFRLPVELSTPGNFHNVDCFCFTKAPKQACDCCHVPDCPVSSGVDEKKWSGEKVFVFYRKFISIFSGGSFIPTVRGVLPLSLPPARLHTDGKLPVKSS